MGQTELPLVKSLKMPNVHFYLKKAEKKTGLSLIYLQSKFDGHRLVYSFKEQIAPAKWNKKRERAKDNNKPREFKKKGEHGDLLNELLENLCDQFDVAYRTFKADSKMKGDIKKYIKDRLDIFLNKKPDGETFFGLLDRLIKGTIGDEKTPATITTYKTAKKHLKEFEEQLKYPLNFASINLEFRDKYKKFLESDRVVKRDKAGKTVRVKLKGMAPNSVYKEIKNVRTIMNLAIEHGLTANQDHKKKKFAVKQEETDSVYLTDKELRDLFKFDLSATKTLEEVRDLFVFSAYVGLRYSDTSRIGAENIIKIYGEDYISIVTQKTKQQVIIPCNDVVLRIFEKYKHNASRLPRALSNQKFNQYIKEVARAAGFSEVGRLGSDLKKPLHEAISSHTARRSFANNALLSGMHTRLIMAVTGHKTEKSFNKYINIDLEKSAQQMNEHNKARSSRSMKKVG
jgi:integrase